ncbi:hypothetical protein C3942_10640 [Solimonas fluminis]|uniref:Uncharacterized protein n=1 Tax=Solimonas fluminis TaxID=2086571 RepID=A0A2S5TFS3_9GAMM|nr:hypothetical protein [Solimonas fluminis]PPE73851.1 hypothetical protein C3942_10640 [Solimonas fluminis]
MELLSQLFPLAPRGLLNALLLFLPPLLILFHPSARWWSRLLWLAATQLCWLFVGLYAWVRLQRYLGDPQMAEFPLADAIGWWSFVFPWMVYLVFRATHPPRGRGDAAPRS